ncbi:MAG: hypothetical protein RO257_02925 [Candidatus Kapabacteria bacterium]|nr:hypothetical protein [Candidatus Kapabacteria bacterium]
METLVLTGNSKSNITLIMNIAKKLGIDDKKINSDDLEDSGLLFAMKKGKTGEFVETDKFIQDLRK